MREMETSLQPFGEFVLKAQLQKKDAMIELDQVANPEGCPITDVHTFHGRIYSRTRWRSSARQPPSCRDEIHTA